MLHTALCVALPVVVVSHSGHDQDSELCQLRKRIGHGSARDAAPERQGGASLRLKRDVLPKSHGVNQPGKADHRPRLILDREIDQRTGNGRVVEQQVADAEARRVRVVQILDKLLHLLPCFLAFPCLDELPPVIRVAQFRFLDPHLFAVVQLDGHDAAVSAETDLIQRVLDA